MAAALQSSSFTLVPNAQRCNVNQALRTLARNAERGTEAWRGRHGGIIKNGTIFRDQKHKKALRHEGGGGKAKAANIMRHHITRKSAQTQPIHAPPTTLSAECGGSAWATRATSRPPTASRWPRPPAARRRRRPPPVIRHRSRADLQGGDRAEEALQPRRRIGRHPRPTWTGRDPRLAITTTLGGSSK